MATFVDLDSMWRDRETYPNPNDYALSPADVETWPTKARTVRAFAQNPGISPLEFATTINIKYLTLPYSETVAEFPRVYVNFRSSRYSDIRLINAIQDRQPDAKFICNFDRIQNDRNGDPTWIHYRCNMEQTMRFERGAPIVFQVTTRGGTILPSLDTVVPDPADPTKQTLCTFEITPYIRDSSYDNHMTSTLAT